MSAPYAKIFLFQQRKAKMLKEKITVGESVNLINDSILNFEDGLSSETINKITYAVNNHIQVRDYLLGLPSFFSMDTCTAFLSYLASSVDGAERYSYNTVNSVYCYESGDTDMAEILLATALDIKSDYSLANLVHRVIGAGWPADSFKTMRDELCDKVIAELEKEKDTLI